MSKVDEPDRRPLGILEDLGQDLRGAYRGLRKSPLLVGVVVTMLALGIGATSTLFAIVDAALLRQLPGAEPERLVWLEEYTDTHETSGGTPLRFADWQRARSFSSMCAVYSDSAIFNGNGGPVRLRLLHTLGDPNKTFQQRLLMGRPFTAGENRAEGQAVALLTSAAWRRYFQSDKDILKRTLRLGNVPYQVVGILDSDAARGVEFPEGVDLWAPAGRDVTQAPREAGFLAQIGRLGLAISMEQARAEMTLLSGRLAAAYPATDKGRSVSLIALQDYVSKEARAPLLTLLAAVGTVLLIACVNISGLLVARGLARQREAAIRISVGAGFSRLVRLFLAESFLLAGSGCALGLLVAYAGIGVLKAALPPETPHLLAAGLDWRVAGWAMGLAGVCAIVFGAIPAWQFASPGQLAALKSGGRGASDNSRSRVRAGLIVAEVAASLVLLVTASLLTGSFFRLRNQAPGFNAASAYSFGVPFSWDTDESVLNNFASGALTRLTTSPGVVAAGVVDRLPLHGGSQSGPILVQGVDLGKVQGSKQVSWRTASAGYFSAAGVPLLSGNLYRDWVGGKGQLQAVITDRLAARLYPGGSPIGHFVSRTPRGNDALSKPHWFQIVGVVGGVRLHPSDQTMEEGVYVPWGATYWPQMNFVVRSTRSLTEFARLVRNHVQPLTNAQLAEKIDTLESLTADTRSGERVRTIMLVTFAGAALALSAIGLFGTLSHEVTRRTQDYGIRLALGAEPRSIAWSAVRSALWLASIGVVVGLAASAWTSRFLQGLLFGIEATDLSAYGVAAIVLLGTAALAAAIPAARAARIDPIQALRHE